MPILERKPVETARKVEREQQKFNIGTATPPYEEKEQSRYSGLSGFAAGFKSVWDARMQELDNSAKAQGALDAQATPKAFDKLDEHSDNIPFGFRKSYKEGYITAATQQALTKFNAGVAVRADDAALRGISTEDFIAGEREHTSNLLESLDKWTPLLPADAKASIAQSLENSSKQGIALFNKARAAKANEAAIRGINEGGVAAGDLFGNALDNGISYTDASKYITDHIDQVVSNPTLNLKDKRAYLINWAQLLAQSTNSPSVINNLANTFAEKITDADTVQSIGKALKVRHDAAANDFSLQYVFKLREQLTTAMASGKTEDMTKFKDSLVSAHVNGYLTTGQALSIWDDQFKPANTKQAVTSSINGVLNSTTTDPNSNIALTVSGIMAQTGADYNTVVNSVATAASDPANSVRLTAAALQGKDAVLIGVTTDKLVGNVKNAIDTIGMSTGEDGDIPQSSRDVLQGLYTMIKTYPDSTSREYIAKTIPAEYRGAIMGAALNSSTSNQANLFDVVRNRYNEIASQDSTIGVISKKDAVKAFRSDANGWGRYFTTFGTDIENTEYSNADNLASQAYAYLEKYDPTALRGTSDGVANVMKTVVASAYTTVPVGNYQTSVGDLSIEGNVLANDASKAGAGFGLKAGVETGLYAETLGGIVKESLIHTLGTDAFNTLNKLQITYGTGGNSGYYMVQATPTDAKSATDIRIPVSLVQDAAVQATVDHLEKQKSLGKATAGASTMFFRDKNGSLESATMQGESPISSISSRDFNNFIVDASRYNYDSKSNDGNGAKYLEDTKKAMTDTIMPAVRDDMFKDYLHSQETLFLLSDIKYNYPNAYKEWHDNLVDGRGNSNMQAPKKVHGMSDNQYSRYVKDFAAAKLLESTSFMDTRSAIYMQKGLSDYLNAGKTSKEINKRTQDYYNNRK